MMKTLFQLFLSVVLTLSVPVSCSELLTPAGDFPPDGAERVVVNCRISIDTRSSFCPDEDSVREWTLMAYCGGCLDKWISGDDVSAPVALPLKKGEEYQIYALANCGDFIPPATEEELKAWTYRGAPSCGGFIPMRWSSGPLDVTPALSLTVAFERLAAKLLLRITDGVGGLRPSSVRVRQAAAAARPFAPGGSTAVPGELADGDYATQADLEQLESGGCVSFYVLENMQGTLLPGNGDPWGKVPDALADPALSACCTYLELCFNAAPESGYIGSVRYRLFLGRDNTSNFDIEGNSELTVSLFTTGDGLDRVSWRVDSELEDKFEYSYEILCPGYGGGVHASCPSGCPDPDGWLTVAQSSRLQIRRIDRLTGESCIVPLRSISSSDSSHYFYDVMDARGGDCVGYDLLLCAPGSPVLTVRTADGACVDVPLMIKAPQLTMGEDCTLMLDGTYLFTDIYWSKYDGEEIDDPESFFDRDAFQQAFTAETCRLVSDRILYPAGSATSTDSSVLGACLDLSLSEVAAVIYVRRYSYGGHSLKEVLDRAVTGNSPGYVRFRVGVESDVLQSHGTISVTVPWTNMPGRRWDDLDDYGIIGDTGLRPGLSVSGNVSTAGNTAAMFFYPVASSDVPVSVSLSKHPVSYYNNPALLSQYEAGVSFSIPAGRKYCTYTFNEGKRPAGELALSARVTNIHSHETMDMELGLLGCYVHIPVFVSVEASVGESYFDTETREQGYWVSADVTLEASMRCQDPVVEGFLKDLFTSGSDASRMLRGPSGNPPGVVQHYSYVRYHTDTYSGMPVDPYLYGDELYYINSIRWNTRLVSMLESVSSRPYVNVYDFGTTTAGGHWYGNYDNRCCDTAGRGYYILEREKVSTRYASANEYRY